MKNPAIKITQSVPLDNREGRECILGIQHAADTYAKACRKAGVEPDDVLTIFIERARIQYRSQSIF